MATTLRMSKPIIRKDRQCFSCYRKFPKGTQMSYWVGLYEGDFNSVYSCLTCQDIMDLSKESEFPEGFVAEWLDKNQTPEQLLEILKTK